MILHRRDFPVGRDSPLPMNPKLNSPGTGRAATAMTVMALMAAVLVLPARAQLVDVTQPGDLIEATSNNSPDREVAQNAIDDQPGTKYLNFDRQNVGFTVVPRTGLT